MKIKVKWIINNEIEMIALGEEFAKIIDKGSIIFLNGEIGAGKTTFTKGFAKGLEIREVITSPTFQIIKEYLGVLCHIDAYRLRNYEELGIENYIENGYYVVIEWPENIKKHIEPNYEINIKYLGNGREVEIYEK